MAGGYFSMSGATGSNFAITRGMLTGYEVYYEGTRFLGMATVDLPEFNYKTNTISGPGIMGEIEFSGLGHTESLEITLNWRNITPELITLAEPRAHDLTLRLSQQNYDQANKNIQSEAVRIDFRGIPKKSPLGKLEHVEQTDSKSTFEIIRLDIYIAGDQVVKYDKVNYICEINGWDFLAEYRANVGLDF